MAPDRGQKTSESSSTRAWEALTPSLSQWILDATAAMGFTKMTPVQASTMPLFLGHKDVVVEAVTGSGKTLAFLIPVIEKLLRNEEPIKKYHVGAIIISPTRELATQIHRVLLSMLEFHGPSAAALKSYRQDQNKEEAHEQDQSMKYSSKTPKVIPQLLIGGSSTPAQDLSTFLKISPNLLIATPGRLLEIMSSPYVHCPQSSFELLVLDEADRLLDLGFKEDLTKILRMLPKQRRTGLFSASVSEAVDQIIRVGLRNPVRIAVKVRSANGVEDKRTPASLQMTYLITPASHKFPALAQLLRKVQPAPLKSIVYLSTCAAVDYIQALLPSILPSGMILVPLHGKHPSNVRQKNFIRFTNAVTPTILLTTDVAARGLDIPSVDLVIQIDPPSDPKVFLHRCGRAGRAGRKGLSVIFLQPGKEEDYISFLEIRKTPIEPLTSPTIELASGDADEILDGFRKIILEDRSLHDKAQKAFVSWVRSYSKHQASSIFHVSDLDWSDLALGWGLLKLPKMPELKTFDKSSFRAPQLDWDEYEYKDKQREKVRRRELEEYKANGPPTRIDRKRTTSVAWSQKLEAKSNREVKRSQKLAKREHDRFTKMTDEEKAIEAETSKMVEQVRLQQLAAARENAEDFEGFD
jgi:ATP-dependent RNA helicase DDX55/SPB4